MRAKDNRVKQHKIQDYFNQKKSKKQQKEKHKQFVKCPLVGQVGSQLKRVLHHYRQEIMKEFDYGELAKQLSQMTHFHNLNGILNSVLYLGITRTSDQVSEIYQPEHVDDVMMILRQLLSSTNVQRFKNWLKHSFAVLRGDESAESDSLETNSQVIESNLLNVFGASGKMSTIVAIARTYNIEVLYTFDYTEKREFEEMFASQHIQFDQNKQRKIIVHRGPLPKFINQKMLQVQKVPFIWITGNTQLKSDTNQQHELFEQFELQQYGHEDLVSLCYVIMFIECNYRDQILKINEEFKSKVIYESIKENGEFYETFSLTKPKITVKQVQVPFTVSEIYILILQMCGNMRTILNWLQYSHEQISTLQIGEKQLEYIIANRLCNMENDLREWFQEQKVHLTDNIVMSKMRLLDENYKIRAYIPRMDYYLVNYALKAFATNNPTHKTRRLNRERTDIYKPLSQFFEDQEQFERFKQLDQF